MPRRQSGWGGKNGGNITASKIGVITAKEADKGHEASHDFWGRQNCSPPGR